jgi:hypothetical protein
MVLKPQDVAVALLLALYPDRRRTFKGVAAQTGLSPSEAHNATVRARKARLIRRGEDEIDGRPVLKAQPDSLLELLLHGIRYVFVPDRGALTRGMPTAHGAPPLDKLIVSNDPPPVWPDPRGSVRGESFQPLYPAAAVAAAADPRMYEALALIDALRGGRSRERKLAAGLLTAMLTVTG